MPVLIDGNNLLFAAREADSSHLLIGRSRLCDMVAAWACRRRARVRVVFDGPAPSPALARQLGNPAIEVSYSGAGRPADAVLTQIIEADSAARRLVVVSSDRAIIRVARRRRARSLRSEEFWARMQSDLSRPIRRVREPGEKEAGLSQDATEWWLGEFGLG